MPKSHTIRDIEGLNGEHLAICRFALAFLPLPYHHPITTQVPFPNFSVSPLKLTLNRSTSNGPRKKRSAQPTLPRHTPLRYNLRVPPGPSAVARKHLLPGHHLHPPLASARHRAAEAAVTDLQVPGLAAAYVEVGCGGVEGCAKVGVRSLSLSLLFFISFSFGRR